MSAWRERLAAAFGSLKLRITLGGIAALAFGIGLSTVLLVQRAERDVLKAQQQRELNDSVGTAALLSHRVVELQRALAAVAAQLDAATLADPAALARFIEGKPVLRGLFASVFVAAPDGRMVLLADANGLRQTGINLADRDYFRRTLAEGRSIISEPVSSRISGGPVIILTQPVRGAGGIRAVLGGGLRLASRGLIVDLVDAQTPDAQALLVVTDAQGRLLAHPDRSRLMHGLAEEPRLAGAFAAWVADGAPVEPAGLSLPQAGEVVSAAGVAGLDWMVWRARSQAELLAPLQAARHEALGWAAGLVALLSAALLVFLRWLLLPLVRLERRAQHLFDGKLDAQEGWPDAHGEIGRLGRVLRHVGAERAQLEAFNSQVLRKLGGVMSAAPVGIAFTRDGRFELVSAECCRLLGRGEEALLGQSAAIIFASGDDYQALGPQVREAFDAQRAYVAEWRMQRLDGSHFWARLRARPVDSADIGAGTIWTLIDSSDQRLAREELEWSVTHDALTGLANRMSFERRAASVFSAMPASLPAVIVFIDLDYFKPINDTFGHAAGDAMLRAVATAMSRAVRASDLVVRLGGDEFALLPEHCPHAVALRIAENVRAAIGAIALAWEGRTLNVGASLGVACLAPAMPTMAAWLNAADAACYAAKAAGRGAVHSASSDEPALVADVPTRIACGA